MATTAGTLAGLGTTRTGTTTSSDYSAGRGTTRTGTTTRTDATSAGAATTKLQAIPSLPRSSSPRLILTLTIIIGSGVSGSARFLMTKLPRLTLMASRLLLHLRRRGQDVSDGTRLTSLLPLYHHHCSSILSNVEKHSTRRPSTFGFPTSP